MLFDNIKRICKMQKTTVKEVERKAGLKNGTIGKWKKCSPRVENLQSVAKVLGVSLERLLK